MISQKRTKLSHRVPGKTQRSSGFTIVEVVIVVAVLGALMLIAFPALSKWVPNYQLKAAAQELYGNLQKAKIQAIKMNRDVTFSFTESADCSGATGYTFTANTTPPQTVASVTMKSGDVCIKDSTFANGTSGFDSRGLPTGGIGSVILTHSKIPSRIHTISQSMSGSIRIQ